jgi:hypothetical protein
VDEQHDSWERDGWEPVPASLERTGWFHPDHHPQTLHPTEPAMDVDVHRVNQWIADGVDSCAADVPLISGGSSSKPLRDCTRTDLERAAENGFRTETIPSLIAVLETGEVSCVGDLGLVAVISWSDGLGLTIPGH